VGGRSAIAGLAKTDGPRSWSLTANWMFPITSTKAEALEGQALPGKPLPYVRVAQRAKPRVRESMGLNTTDTSLSEPMRSFIESVTTRSAAR